MYCVISFFVHDGMVVSFFAKLLQLAFELFICLLCVLRVWLWQTWKKQRRLWLKLQIQPLGTCSLSAPSSPSRLLREVSEEGQLQQPMMMLTRSYGFQRSQATCVVLLTRCILFDKIWTMFRVAISPTKFESVLLTDFLHSILCWWEFLQKNAKATQF